MATRALRTRKRAGIGADSGQYLTKLPVPALRVPGEMIGGMMVARSVPEDDAHCFRATRRVG